MTAEFADRLLADVGAAVPSAGVVVLAHGDLETPDDEGRAQQIGAAARRAAGDYCYGAYTVLGGNDWTAYRFPGDRAAEAVSYLCTALVGLELPAYWHVRSAGPTS